MPIRDTLAYGILIYTKDGEITRVANPGSDGSVLQVAAELVRDWERTERSRSWRTFPGPFSLRDGVLHIRLSSGWVLRWHQLVSTPSWPEIDRDSRQVVYRPQVVIFRRVAGLPPPGWRPDVWLWMQDYAARIFAPPLFDTESNPVLK